MKKTDFWENIIKIDPSTLTNTFGEMGYLDGNLKLLRSVIDNGFSHIIVTDSNGYILYTNNSSEEITGYSREEMLGKTPALWGNQMTTHYYEALWKTIKIEKINFNGIITNRRKNGELYEAEIRISPMLDDKGELKFFIALERDITKENETEKSKNEFISLAAHELKTPLSTISIASEMLLRGIVGDVSRENKKYLKIIFLKIRDMVEMIEKFLDVSRIELGKFPITTEPTNLFKTVDKIIRDCTPQIKEKKITFKKDYKKIFPTLLLDKKVLKIIVENLLFNAIKYTNQNGKITLKIDETNNVINIKVKDNGIGIPERDQHKIFTKMFRAENVLKNKTEGTGLGLYFVKRLVKQCGFTITFKSKEDRGTTFFVTIPKKQVDENQKKQMTLYS